MSCSARFGFLFFSFGYPMQGLKTFGLIGKKKRGYSSMCSGRIIWVDLAAVCNEEDVKKRVEHLMLVLVQGEAVDGKQLRVAVVDVLNNSSLHFNIIQ